MYVYYNMFCIALCVMLTNDGSEIAETCRRYINCTVVYKARAKLGCVNKINIYIYIYIYIYIQVSHELRSLLRESVP